MLAITEKQMGAFEALTRRQFEDAMVEHMRVRSSRAKSLPADQVRARVLQLIDEAEGHGIDEEPHVRRFIEFFFDRPPGATSEPPVAAVLDAPKLSSSAKMAFIADALSGRTA